MYEPEHFISHGVIQEPDPPRELSAPRPPQLYNVARIHSEDDLATVDTQRADALSRKLDGWFEEVEWIGRVSMTCGSRGRPAWRCGLQPRFPARSMISHALAM